MNLENPKIRPIEAFPAQLSGKNMIGVKDPAGISPEIVFVPPETFFLITLMDGKLNLRDLQAAYMRKYGDLLFTDKLEEFIAQLDSYYLLENRRFFDHLRHLQEEFREAKTRPAAFAGKGYEDDPERLKAQLQGYFTEGQGPGLVEDTDNKKELKGIVAPHIDFARGGTCYADAYKTLGESIAADLYVVLGTCHTPMRNPFAFSLKTFETPLGKAEVLNEVVEEAAAQLPFDPFHDEFAHRQEHTIEFQVVFLQHIWGEARPKILPILCGSFEEMIRRGVSPMEDPIYRQSISVLKETLAPLPHVCLIASADLAHVGPQFGDVDRVTPGTLTEIKAKDLEMLGYVGQLKGEEFYRSILQEGDRRKICGLPPIYALLNITRAQRGELLRYQQWCDPQGRGTVTFASMAFT